MIFLFLCLVLRRTQEGDERNKHETVGALSVVVMKEEIRKESTLQMQLFQIRRASQSQLQKDQESLVKGCAAQFLGKSFKE